MVAWWLANFERYPILAKFAKKYFSSNSNVYSERLFCEADNVYENKCNRLLPLNAEKFVSFHHNLQLVNFQCDQAMKQFLLHLDETLALGRKFIIQDLDECHLFISADIVETLQAKIDDLMDQISIPVHDKGM